MITKEELRVILQECAASGLPEEVDDDTPIVMDSFALVWLRHLLQERHQIVLEVANSQLEELNSLQSIYAFLAKSESRS
ncbi:hypothetical protein [Streptomyces tanashiensis]|uniref:hypothetical protein n=1 Tax=Streptomyces tanashiensis TaxID=67367 RepID=UPI0034014DC4